MDVWVVAVFFLTLGCDMALDSISVYSEIIFCPVFSASVGSYRER